MPKRIFSCRFTTGQVSPAIAARADWARWPDALTEARNVVLTPQGGARKRPVLRRLAAADAGAARIFGWDKSEVENFVVAVSADKSARIYPTSSEFLPSQLEVAGTLEFGDIEAIKGFHFADTLIITAPDQWPQRIFLQDSAALLDRDDLTEFVAEFTGDEIGDITIAIGNDSVEIPRPKTQQWRSQYRATWPQGDNNQGVRIGFGRWENSQSLADSAALFTGRFVIPSGFSVSGNVSLTGTREMRQNPDALPLFFSEDIGGRTYEISVSSRVGGFRVVVCFPEVYADEAITITAEIDGDDQSEFYGVEDQDNTINPADGFAAGYMDITNPPVRSIDKAEYDRWQAKLAEGDRKFAVRIAAVNVDGAKRGQVVKVADGVPQEPATPGAGEIGLPGATKTGEFLYWLLMWNPEDGYPVHSAYHRNRLLFGATQPLGANLWWSAANKPLDFTQEQFEPAGTADEPSPYQTNPNFNGALNSLVQPNFGMFRGLDEYDNIVAFLADADLLLLTARGMSAITGALDATDANSPNVRPYSRFGSNQNAGVAAADRQAFWAKDQAAFSLWFDSPDGGYQQFNITAARNETIFGGREVRRVAAAQPKNLNGANIAAFLLDAPAGETALAVYFSEIGQEFGAWATWDFPGRRVIDIAATRNQFFLLVEDEDGTRGIYTLDGAQAATSGAATDEGEVVFECAIATCELAEPRFEGEGWIYPKTILRGHITAERAGGEQDNDTLKLAIRHGDTGADDEISEFPNRADDDAELADPENPLVGKRYGRRAAEIGVVSVADSLDRRRGVSARVFQANTHPLHLLRLDIEMDVESLMPNPRERRA